MIRRLPSLRTAISKTISKTIVALALFGALLTAVTLPATVQALGKVELSPGPGGEHWHRNPDMGGDDDQPTVMPQASPRVIAQEVTEYTPLGGLEESSSGQGKRSMSQGGSFATTVRTAVTKRIRAIRLILGLSGLSRER